MSEEESLNHQGSLENFKSMFPNIDFSDYSKSDLVDLYAGWGNLTSAQKNQISINKNFFETPKELSEEIIKLVRMNTNTPIKIPKNPYEDRRVLS